MQEIQRILLFKRGDKFYTYTFLSSEFQKKKSLSEVSVYQRLHQHAIICTLRLSWHEIRVWMLTIFKATFAYLSKKKKKKKKKVHIGYHFLLSVDIVGGILISSSDKYIVFEESS